MTTTFSVTPSTTPTPTPTPMETTTAPTDCIYIVTGDALSGGQIVDYQNGITAKIDENDDVVFNFPEPRRMSEIVVQLTSGQSLEVVPTYDDGTEGEAVPVTSTPDEATTTELNQPNVINVVVRTTDGSPISPAAIVVVQVIACELGEILLID